VERSRTLTEEIPSFLRIHNVCNFFHEFSKVSNRKMNPIKTGKSAYVMLGLGIAVGGLAVASLPNLVPSVHADPEVVARPIAGITQENMNALRALDNSFASLAEYIEPSVVNIKSTGTGGSDVFGRRMGEVSGVGTGVIFRPDGWIITNDHVVGGFDKVTVTLSDGREFQGTVRRAPDNDLAVVKINASSLPAAKFGDSTKVRPGQFAMAVGSPFNLDETVTVGHISALNRNRQIPDERLETGGRLYTDLIQTDAAINMGNSGGPLVNVDGQVVGINSAIYSGTGGSVGIGFAIPSNQARMIAERLIEKGSVSKGYLGLVPEDLKAYQLKERNMTGGAAVATDPENDGPAGMAGIKKDDVIVRIGSYAIRNQQDVRDAMFNFSAGSIVPVEVIRGSEHKTFQVKVGDYSKAQAARVRQMAPTQQPEGQQLAPNFEGFPDLKQFGDMFNRRRGQGQQVQPKGDVPPIRQGKARLGVSVEALTDTLRTQFNIPKSVEGVVVTTVMPGSTAEKLGIEPGTVIQKLGDKTIRTGQDLIDAMQKVNYGDTRSITFAKYSADGQAVQTQTVTFK